MKIRMYDLLKYTYQSGYLWLRILRFMRMSVLRTFKMRWFYEYHLWLVSPPEIQFREEYTAADRFLFSDTVKSRFIFSDTNKIRGAYNDDSYIRRFIDDAVRGRREIQ